MTEVCTAFDLLKALSEGRAVEGLTLSGSLGDAAAFLGGRLNMDCVALAGHSYGGATVAALTAADARFCAGIALDPWWCAYLPSLHPRESSSVFFCSRRQQTDLVACSNMRAGLQGSWGAREGAGFVYF